MYVFRSRTLGAPLFCYACGQEVEDTEAPDLKANGLYAHPHVCPKGREDRLAYCFLTGRATDCTPVINGHVRETDCEIFKGKCRKGWLESYQWEQKGET